jgi:hypothetical protein
MLTKKIANFSDDLLNTVRGILGEAKKHDKDCECEKCEAEDEMKEGAMPTADEPTEANKKTAQKIRDMMAKEKKPVKEDAEHDNCGTPECCGQCDTAEQIDEVSKATLGRYINKAKDSIDTASYRQGHKEAHGSSSKPLEKKLTKRHKGISTAVNKLTKEESEQIDELSKATLGSYVKKAQAKTLAHGMEMQRNIDDFEDTKDAERKVNNRFKGVSKAVDKLTKEEQDFVDSLNDEMFEEIEIAEANLKVGDYTASSEKSKFHKKGYRPHLKNPQGKTSYLAGVAYKSPEHAAGEAAAYHKGYTSGPGRASERGADDAVRAYRHKNKEHMHEEAEITEARGRPKKAGAKDFTIHPKTKEKMMHNNPEHMKRIERLQKNGILEKPKVEAGQHIMNQLSKAKTSMLGGSKINFTHGDSKEVSGTHAAKILAKYAGMKPNEKEDFQKFVGHSHENLMKHV